MHMHLAKLSGLELIMLPASHAAGAAHHAYGCVSHHPHCLLRSMQRMWQCGTFHKPQPSSTLSDTNTLPIKKKEFFFLQRPA
jgi:hypothetical protein